MKGKELHALLRLPDKGGRSVVARVLEDGRFETSTPVPLDARTRVNECSGSSFAVRDGDVFISNFPCDRIHCRLPGEKPRPDSVGGDVRNADFVVDPRRNRLICIREDQVSAGDPAHTVAAVDLAGEPFGDARFERAGFFAFPDLSGDGGKPAWVAWDHQGMPFFSCAIGTDDAGDDGVLADARQIPPEQEESITDSRWSPEDVLSFGSDRTDGWDHYHWREGEVSPVCPIEAEQGIPYLSSGKTMYRFLTQSRVLAA
ncbi:MAG: hypothetical protein OXF62_04700 [Caldilineaceae bacterium]|nr:hypothetical protein [Caldilineaceae bacterium]MCY4115468.1 hypothetical protein [Caldilineaceae bacterium]